MLPHKKLVSIIALVSVFACVGGIGWVVANSHREIPTQEQVRDAAMNYVKINHPETVQFMTNLAWTGGRVEPKLLGAETYTYDSGGWRVTIKYPVIAYPAYSITVNYTTQAGSPSIPYAINWQGTWDNGAITETDYTFAQ